MARQVQLRRGTTAEHSTFTGAVGEVTVDTDKDVVVVHDGSTAGGFPLVRQLSDFGITATAIELNYVDGVTSAIQTQLDGKMTPTYTGNVDITGELIVDSYNETYATASSSAGVLTINCEAGNVFQVTLTENVTSASFSNPPASGTAYGFTLRVIQDATARTITWPASVDWPAATAPTLSAGSGDVDVFAFFTTDGGTTWYGFTAGQALA